MIKSRPLIEIAFREALHIWKLAYGEMIPEMFNDKFHDEKFELRKAGTIENPLMIIVEIDRNMYCSIDADFNVNAFNDNDEWKPVQSQALIQNYFMRQSFYTY